jgi:hypothetical protein
MGWPRAASFRLLAAVLAVVASFLTAAPPAGANPVLVVTSTADSGPNTLRAAITKANTKPGPDRIEFDIGGPSPHVIAPTSGLPEISETLTIDGTTQPGFSRTTHKPVVVLDGASAGNASALKMSGSAAGGTQIRGLEIIRFQFAAIFINGVQDVVIAGNYIGTDGIADLGNGSGFMNVSGVIEVFGESRNLLIGGRTPAARNVISGNSSSGIYLPNGVGTRVQGNYLGTNAAGTAAVDPGGQDGVNIETGGGVTVGGTAPGAGNLLSGNVRGVVVGADGWTIVGNRIGTNAAGTAAIPNGAGVQVFFGRGVIGGTTAAARNLISGNPTGVALGGSGVVVQGNRIGTNANGTAAVANDVGVNIGSCCSSTDDNRIGGSAAGAGNVISGNRIGLQIAPGNANGTETGNNNVVQGNRIGTRPNGKTPLPNTEGGVVIQHTGGGAATGNQIGGLVPGAGNVIAFNGGPGVAIGGDASVSHNSVRGNSIRGNSGLGIDLGPAGVTPNDEDDADAGPNGLQDFPGISSAQSGPSGTSIFGTLESHPIDEFHLDFYASDGKDPSGSGEGARYLGDVFLITDAGGNAAFGVTFPGVQGNFVTATATSGPGDTSEFSVAQAIVGPGGLRFSSSAYTVREGAGHATVTVQRVGGSDGAVSVHFETANGSAKAPGDYTSRSGRLRFADGQKTRTFTVPIVNDTRHEPAESFTVRLSDARGGAALGTPTTAKVTIRASD